MKIRTIVEITSTKRDTYGNCYHVAKITNTANGKSFSTKAASGSNVEHILSVAFGGWREAGIYMTEKDTGSARLSSLPTASHNLNGCHYDKAWKKSLNGIGLRNLKAVE